MKWLAQDETVMAIAIVVASVDQAAIPQPGRVYAVAAFRNLRVSEEQGRTFQYIYIIRSLYV